MGLLVGTRMSFLIPFHLKALAFVENFFLPQTGGVFVFIDHIIPCDSVFLQYPYIDQRHCHPLNVVCLLKNRAERLTSMQVLQNYFPRYFKICYIIGS